MYLNYLKIAWRSLQKNRLYSSINVIGLAIGIAVSTIIMLYVIDELSYDKWHSKSDRIFRVAHIRNTSGITLHEASTPMYLGSLIKNNISNVANSVRFLKDPNTTILLKDQLYEENQFAFADPEVFSVFDISLIQGDKKPFSI